MQFKIHQIKDQSLGNLFKSIRLNKNISLEEVEKNLNIAIKFIKAIEENNWKIFPGPTYTKGFLIRYGNFLGLDQDKIISFFKKIEPQLKSSDYQKNTTAKSTRRTIEIRKIIFAGLFLLVVLYITLTLFKSFLPPKIIILSPKNNLITREKSVTIEGKVKTEAQVFINDQPVIFKSPGYFKEVVEIPTIGENLITIRALDNRGKEKIIQRKITRQP